MSRPGNLVGTLLAWRAAVASARSQGWDLDREWRSGALTVGLVHAAGLGRRTAPLIHAEDDERGNILLPGRIGRQPARLLEAVIAQTAPLAASQPAGFLDVLWSSQLFVPTVAPGAVPPPTRPLTKLVTSGGPQTDAAADVGLFQVRDGVPVRFHAQGTLDADQVGGLDDDLANDLGSFRLRADLLDVLTRVYLRESVRGPRDLDPHLTAPLLGAPRPADVGRVLEDLGEADIVGVTDLGERIPWWRLRHPRELRSAALDLRPSQTRGEPLRRLLGIDHPVMRSWLGEVWVDGPEISWEQAVEGVEIGGAVLEDTIVHDSALWPWKDGGRTPVQRSVARRSVLSHCAGGFDVEDTWLMACGGPGLRGGGGLAWRITGDPPPAAGPSPMALGLCSVRRPRLRDGVAQVHGFLAQDAKSEEDVPRDGLGLSWSELRKLAPFRGPVLPGDAPWPAAQADALDNHLPHLAMTMPRLGLALLRERLPPGCDLHRLLERAEDGVWKVGLHRGSRPLVDIDAPLAPGRLWDDVDVCYTMHADLETWERWGWAPERLAEELIRVWSTHFVAPHPDGRGAWARRRLADWRRGTLVARESVRDRVRFAQDTGDERALLGLAGDWRLLDDPDRVDLAEILQALDDQRPDARRPRTGTEMLGFLRWRLDHCRDDIGALTENVASADAEILANLGFRWAHPWEAQGQPRWVPSRSLAPTRAPDRELDQTALAEELVQALLDRRRDGPAPSLGVCGPAAAGKSSLAVAVAELLDDAGLTVGFLETDTLTWRGPGFRYDQGPDSRLVRIYGPAIYDDVRLAWRLDALRAKCDVVIAEGVYVGLDPDVRERLDLRVGIVMEDQARLDTKYGRDSLAGNRRIDVVTDFAAKIVHESHDGVAPALRGVDVIWDRAREVAWNRRA